jgi:diguanylate cyclase (GGDEF)-like protein/PAS domain S-box-containing protein
MGPAALPLVLLIRRFGLVAPRPVWTWVCVFLLVPAVSEVVDRLYARRPSTLSVHLRTAWHVAAVTVVVYLTGWGPVLVGAYAFVALEHLHSFGSAAWRKTASWSVAGIAGGQLGVWQGWFPSFLPDAKAQALGVMGTFVLLFVIRMAGAIMQQKEQAEAFAVASEDRFRSLVQHSSDTTIVVGPDRLVSYASPATVALLGRQPEAVVGRLDLDMVHPEDRQRATLQLGTRLRTGNVDPVEFRMVRADGQARHVEAVITDLRDRPSVGGYVVNMRDITERKEAERLLAHQALHDPLTGLPNRTLILDRAEQMLVRARREHHPIAALFVDLDNFKDINDTLGHQAGDRVLQAVAGRLSGILRASDTVGRLGGDEFVVLAEGVSLAAGPDLVAERIQDVLREPFRIAGFADTSLHVAASIGIASGERGSATELLRAADIALYRAKAAGKNCAASFAAEMESEVLSRLELRMDLQTALEEGAFFLLYQPVFDLETMRACGVEALLRWRHPARGVIQPDEFVPLLEESGRIVGVGRWVLTEACRQAADWHRRGFAIKMSVNISVRQLESDAIVTHVAEALSESGLAPDQLVVEITETALMRDAEAAAARLRALKELGVLVAIDDFGTGYSSLAYLRQFPVDALKIDRSFVTAVVDSPESATLVHTLVELGRNLGLETLAEGIEDSLHLERLRAHDCELGQGFLFSEPVEASVVEAMLVRQAGLVGKAGVAEAG